MKASQVKGSVIWRLPGASDIHIIDPADGEDMFLLSYFDKALEPLMLQGCLKKIPHSGIPSFFESWQPIGTNDRASTKKEDYISWVEKSKEEISSGKLGKVVLAQRQWHETPAKLHDVFNSLMSNYPNAFVYAFNIEGGITMVGASPESLLRRNGEMLYTEALGGTRTRGQYTEKEILEHQHISGYIAGILSKHGAAVKGEMTTRTAGQVEHLLTPFELSSAGLEKDLQLAFELHPTPAVCGLPFMEAFEYIGQTENFDRRFYSGFLGPVAASGDFSLFVNLRCAELYQDGVVLYAGAGLNAMSNAEDEWQETLQKMQTVLHCIN